MRIASWNIRGLGAQEKKLTVKRLIKGENIDLLGLVETKHAEITVWSLKKIWGNQNVDWVQSPAENGSGGILVSWHKDSFEVASSLVTQRWICVFGKFKQEGLSCAVCVLYAPNNKNARLQMWNNLRDLKQHLTLLLILMGDFNEVIKIEERRNATRVTMGMRDLGDLIDDLQLFDLDINQPYTWMRDNAASRLDRILVSKEVMDWCQNLRVQCKERMLSNHYPLILTTANLKWGPAPFRSLDGWLEEPKFMEMFKKEWIQMSKLSFEQKSRP